MGWVCGWTNKWVEGVWGLVGRGQDGKIWGILIQIWSRNTSEKRKTLHPFQQPPLKHSCGGHYSLQFIHKTANGNKSAIHPSPSQPALVSGRIFSRPEFAPCLEFILKTECKEFTGRSPMELMLCVAINFINEAAFGSSFFSPFPLCSRLSEMWKSFNPLSFLTASVSASLCLRLTLRSKKVRVCVCSQGRAGSPGYHLIPDNTTQPWY